ncbi:MAG: holin [Clostridia bacterium]|nr:holin [Clostridia bacterium]
MEYIDLTNIVAVIIGLILALVARYAVPFLKEKYGEAKFQNIAKYVKIAVGAAEMLYSESGAGAEKKAYVIDYLKRKGFTIDFETLDNLIENAVFELNKE